MVESSASASAGSSRTPVRRAARGFGGDGQALAATSKQGAGRELQAASGRAMTCAAAGAVVSAQADAAAAAQRRQQREAAAAATGSQGGVWDTALSVLLAPAAPLLASLRGTPGGTAPAGANKYDMLLDLMSGLAQAPAAQVRRPDSDACANACAARTGRRAGGRLLGRTLCNWRCCSVAPQLYRCSAGALPESCCCLATRSLGRCRATAGTTP